MTGADRYLPPGFPLPDPHAMGSLRETILRATRTPHAPEPAELALVIAADEAGVDLGEIDARAVWELPAEARAPVFEAIAKVLRQLAD